MRKKSCCNDVILCEVQSFASGFWLQGIGGMFSKKKFKYYLEIWYYYIVLKFKYKAFIAYSKKFL